MTSSVPLFLSLPVEIRFRIYTYYLQSIDLYAESDLTTLHDDKQPLIILESNNTDRDEESEYKPPAPIPYHYIHRQPAILYVNKLIHVEVTSLQWQSLVRYNFSSTIAMLDVLTAISLKQRQLIRKVRVVGTALLLDYRVYEMPRCLVLLEGLELDLLEIVDPYPSDPGDPTDQLVAATVRWLLYTSGWKEAHVIVGDYPLQAAHIDDLVGIVERLNSDRDESGPCIEFPTSPIDWDPTLRRMITSEFVRNHRAWDRPTLNVIVKRGAGAKYVQKGDDSHSGLLSRLRAAPDWAEMRRSNHMLEYGGRLANL